MYHETVTEYKEHRGKFSALRQIILSIH